MEEKADRVEVTMDMLRAGYEAFSDWDEEVSEPAVMLVPVYEAMSRAATPPR